MKEIIKEDAIMVWEYSMTIYFFRRTGVISEFQVGINSMDTFGEHRQEYEQIMDFVVMQKDDFFLTHSRDFKIDTETKELIYLVNTSKYKML